MDEFSYQGSSNVKYFEYDEAKKSFEELFNPNFLKNNNRPLKERRFPKSFFQPNEKREDGCELSISHSKTRSSPATFGNQLNTLSPFSLHTHHKSLDVNTVAQKEQDFILPEFRNNLLHQKVYPGVLLKHAKCQMPEGFEMAINADNCVYFLNHKTQQTTWFDPRIPQSFQKWGMTPRELDEAHCQYNKSLEQYQISKQESYPFDNFYQNPEASNTSQFLIHHQRYPSTIQNTFNVLEQDMQELQLNRHQQQTSNQKLFSDLNVYETNNNNNNNSININPLPYDVDMKKYHEKSHLITTNNVKTLLNNEQSLYHHHTTVLKDAKLKKGPFDQNHSYQNSTDSGVCQGNISISEDEYYYGIQRFNQNCINNQFSDTNRELLIESEQDNQRQIEQDSSREFKEYY